MGDPPKKKIVTKRIPYLTLTTYDIVDMPLDAVIMNLTTMKEGAEEKGFIDIAIVDDGGYGDYGFHAYLEGKRAETDKELAKRLKKEARIKDDKRAIREAKIVEERKTYERLKKKFG